MYSLLNNTGKILICFFLITMWTIPTVSAVKVGELQYRDTGGDHLDSVFSFMVEQSSDSETECEHFSYKLDFFNMMNGVSEINQPEGKFSICEDDSFPMQLFTFHQTQAVSQYGIFAREKVMVSGAAEIDSWTGTRYTTAQAHGHIYSNGSVYLTGSASINGDIYCNDVSNSSGVDLNGEIYSLSTPLEWFSTQIDQGFELAASIGTQLSSFRTKGEIVLEEGIYCVPELILETGQSLRINGKVILFCEGDIILKDDSFINTPEQVHDLVIYSHYGNVLIADQARLSAQIFALNGTISLEQDAAVFGQLVADQVSLYDKTSLHYNEDKYEQSLSFARLEISDNTTVKTSRAVVYAEHRNSCLGTKRLVVRDGSFAWLASLAEKGKADMTTLLLDKHPITHKGYSQHSMLIEHCLMSRIVFDELEHTTDNIREVILNYNHGLDTGEETVYCNMVRHWAVHWSNYNQDMNGVNKIDDDNVAHTYQPFRFTGTRDMGDGVVYQKYCPGKITLKIPEYDPYGNRDYYNSYFARFARLAGDLNAVGTTIQLDFFDICMATPYNWDKNPYNPFNQGSYPCIPPYPVCKNEFLSTDSARNFISCSESNFPLLFEQQLYLIDRMVSFCENLGFDNVFFDIVNEGINYDWKVRAWYDDMIEKVKATNADALVSINCYPVTLGSPAANRADFEVFWADLNQKANVDIISYHFPYWFDNGQDDIAAHFTWHNQLYNPAPAIIYDDDGDMNNYRENNANVADWSYKCTGPRYANFNHKDNQKFLTFNSTPRSITQDYYALYAISRYAQYPSP